MILKDGQFPARCPTCKVVSPGVTGKELQNTLVEPTFLLHLAAAPVFAGSHFFLDVKPVFVDSDLWKGSDATEFVRRFNAQQLQHIVTISPTFRFNTFFIKYSSTSTVRATCPKCATLTIGGDETIEPCVRCVNPVCASLFCRNCKGVWHSGLTCQQNTEKVEGNTHLNVRSVYLLLAVDKTLELIQATAKHCPHCGISTC